MTVEPGTAIDQGSRRRINNRPGEGPGTGTGAGTSRRTGRRGRRLTEHRLPLHPAQSDTRLVIHSSHRFYQPPLPHLSSFYHLILESYSGCLITESVKTPGPHTQIAFSWNCGPNRSSVAAGGLLLACSGAGRRAPPDDALRPCVSEFTQAPVHVSESTIRKAPVLH